MLFRRHFANSIFNYAQRFHKLCTLQINLPHCRTILNQVLKTKVKCGSKKIHFPFYINVNINLLSFKVHRCILCQLPHLASLLRHRKRLEDFHKFCINIAGFQNGI